MTEQRPTPEPAGDGGVPVPPLSRRSFLKGAGGIAAGGTLTAALAEARRAAAETAQVDGPARVVGLTEVELTVNRAARKVKVEPRTTLLSALRVRLDPPLTGSKEVCDRGACGACTVLVDDEPAYACMLLAADCVGKRVTTVEGLGTPEKLSPVQEAFWQKDAQMCGFCTPGFVVSVSACIRRNPVATEADVREACAGNLCRCGTYPHVWAAAAMVTDFLKSGAEADDGH